MIDLGPIREAVDACTLAYGRGDADAWRANGWDVEPIRWGSTEATVLEADGRLVIAYAGSNDIDDLFNDLQFWPRPWRHVAGRVHRGISRHYERSATWMLDRIDAAITRGATIDLDGHSLGAAEAELLALDTLHRLGHTVRRVCAFGAVRAFGWRAAGEYAAVLGHRTWRVVSVDGDGVHDGLTRVMPRWAGYEHVGVSVVLHPGRVRVGEPAWRELRGLRPGVWPWQLRKVVREIRSGGRAHRLGTYRANLGGIEHVRNTSG